MRLGIFVCVLVFVVYVVGRTVHSSAHTFETACCRLTFGKLGLNPGVLCVAEKRCGEFFSHFWFSNSIALSTQRSFGGGARHTPETRRLGNVSRCTRFGGGPAYGRHTHRRFRRRRRSVQDEKEGHVLHRRDEHALRGVVSIETRVAFACLSGQWPLRSVPMPQCSSFVPPVSSHPAFHALLATQGRPLRSRVVDLR